MTADYPAPDVLDAAPAPDGRRCKLWRPDDSGEMMQCDRDAEVVFVYDGKLDDSETIPRNALACRQCAPTDELRELRRER